MKTASAPRRMSATAKPKASKPKRPAAPKKAKASAKAPSKPRPRALADDWRLETLDTVRRLIRQADPDAVEEVKWRKPSNAIQGVPVWSHGGMICTGETYKDKVKLTFAKGAALDDPAGLFNADDKGNTRRAIDLREGETVDPAAFKALVKAAVALNGPAKGRA
jgi:hypothetical protein